MRSLALVLAMILLGGGVAGASDLTKDKVKAHKARAAELGKRFVNRSMGQKAAEDQDVRWMNSRNVDARTYRRGGALHSELLARSGEQWDSFTIYRNRIVERGDKVIMQTRRDGQGTSQTTTVLDGARENHSEVRGDSHSYQASRTTTRRLRLDDETIGILRDLLGAGEVKRIVAEREPVLLAREVERERKYGQLTRKLGFSLELDRQRTELEPELAAALSLHLVGR